MAEVYNKDVEKQLRRKCTMKGGYRPQAFHFYRSEESTPGIGTPQPHPPFKLLAPKVSIQEIWAQGPLPQEVSIQKILIRALEVNIWR